MVQSDIVQDRRESGPPADDARARPAPRRTQFYLFFTARTTAMLGDTMRPVALAAAVLAAGYGASGVGYSLAAEMAPFALFVLIGGVLADRFTPRRMMICADILRFVVLGGLAAGFAMGDPPLWLILVLLVFTGLGTAVFQPGVASVMPQVAADVQKGNAAIRVSESLMSVVGPALAGLLLVVSDPWVVIGLDAVTFVISAVCLFALRLSAQRSTSTPMLRGLIDGWREFTTRTWLWGTIAIWIGGGLLCRGPTHTLGASVMISEWGSTAYGLTMSIFGLGNFVGGLIAFRLKPDRPLVAGAIAVGTFVLSPLTIALGLPLPLIAAGHFIHGIGATFWLVMWHTTIQTQVPGPSLSRVHAYDIAGSLLATPVGRAVAGPAGEHVGPHTVLFIAAGAGAVVSAMLLSLRAVRELRARTTPTA